MRSRKNLRSAISRISCCRSRRVCSPPVTLRTPLYPFASMTPKITISAGSIAIGGFAIPIDSFTVAEKAAHVAESLHGEFFAQAHAGAREAVASAGPLDAPQLEELLAAFDAEAKRRAAR